MRALHVHWTALPAAGGVEVHSAAVVAQLREQGVDAELLSGTPDAEIGSHQTALTLGTEATPAQLDDLVAACHRADVVHWHNPQWHKPEVTAHVSDRLRRGGWRGTLVLDLHNIDTVPEHWTLLAGLPGRIVAHSHFVAEQVTAYLPDREVTVLPLALDRTTAPYQLPGSAAVTVLQPTRLTTWKGSDQSLTAAVDLLDQGEDLDFVHAGTENLVWRSNIPQELLDRVQPWRDRGRVHFVHYSPAQSWSAIAGADLIVHPTADRGTHGEPFSLSVAQAIICGRPVVATDSGHLPALLQGYEKGQLIPVGDLPALTQAMRSACRSGKSGASPGGGEPARRLSAWFAGAGHEHAQFYTDIAALAVPSAR